MSSRINNEVTVDHYRDRSNWISYETQDITILVEYDTDALVLIKVFNHEESMYQVLPPSALAGCESLAWADMYWDSDDYGYFENANMAKLIVISIIERITI